jgi:hypothetical protein
VKKTLLMLNNSLKELKQLQTLFELLESFIGIIDLCCDNFLSKQQILANENIEARESHR